MKPFSHKALSSLTLLQAVLDCLSFQAALGLGYWLWVSFPWHGNTQPFSDYALTLWTAPPVGLLVFRAVGLYKREMGILGVEEQSLVFKAVWILYLMIFALSFFYREVRFSRLATFYSIFLCVAFVSFGRFLMRRIFEWLHRKGIGIRKAIIYGAGYHGQRLARWIHQSPKLGIRIIGYLDEDISRLEKKPELPCFGNLKMLEKISTSQEVGLLFIAHRNLSLASTSEIFQHCESLGIQCWAIPSLYQFNIEKIKWTNIGGIPLVGYSRDFTRRSYLILKRILDAAFSAALLIIFSPLIILISLGVWGVLGRPIFFTQTRVGAEGRKFRMFKFRTLDKAERRQMISPELQKKGNLPFLAVFLRRTGLDEIPQLWNVLRGKMSIIGPRPEMPFIVAKYGTLERERLRIKPGITGLWQISEDRKRLLIHENMDYDLYYVEHCGFNLDLAILVKTFFVVFARFAGREKAA